MSTAFAVVLSLAAAAAPASSAFKFQGVLTARQPAEDEQSKKFEMTVVPRITGDEQSFFWMVEERGRGSLAWPDHLGNFTLDPMGRIGETPPLSMLLDRPGGNALIPLPLPVLGSECPLEANGKWMEGKLEYKVVGVEMVDGKPTARIEAGNNYGVRRRLWVDVQTRVVKRSSSSIFVGQGEEHELRYELADEIDLSDAAERDKVQRGVEAILDLKQTIGREPNLIDGRWTPKQLSLLKERLPALVSWQKHPVLGSLVESIDQELRLERGRAGSAATMREKALGKMQGLQGLVDAAGKEIARELTQGHVLVLHFWDYKDQPLVEPYGQVGYVDFLYRRHKEAGARVYGVAVDPRWADTSARRSVAIAAQKLVNFMNLTYPILFDDGAILKQLGDPRVAGNRLPLFVVIDRSGRVVEYHSGHYEVHRDRGLEELDQIVKKALDKSE